MSENCFLFNLQNSIGSLGRDSVEAGVQNVTVKTATFTGTENGVRIKSWARPSNGFARNIRFQHCVMNNVQNPIVIDQNYCPGNENCPNQVCSHIITQQNINYSSICRSNINWIMINRFLGLKSAM